MLKSDQILYENGEITVSAALSARVLRKNEYHFPEDLGVVSRKMVSDQFLDFLVDQMQSSSGEISGFRVHKSGIGATAESAGDTALVTEVGTPVTGTRSEGATSKMYKTVAVSNYSAAFAIREHGIFDAVGRLLDRSVFSVINVDDGDSIEWSYELTFSRG